jgi:lipoyl(octanoyl) transferase
MKPQNLDIQFQYIGRKPYAEALLYQQELHRSLHEEIASGHKPRGIVLGLEHPAIITLGKRGDALKDLRLNPSADALAITDVVQVERGGQATLHSEGQLVIYPILPLLAWGIGARTYVESLQRATQDFFSAYNIPTHFNENEPGLYTRNGKVAFFGVQIRQGISMHGVAINIVNDLNLFSQIRSCGKDQENFDRLNPHTQSLLSLESYFQNWQRCFLIQIASNT